MLERRQHERFDLILPATIELLNSEEEEISDVLSSNISAGGAYFHTEQPLPEGRQIRLRIRVTNERLQKLTGSQVLIKVGGTVLRSSPKGMAICFGEDYQMLRLRVSLS